MKLPASALVASLILSFTQQSFANASETHADPIVIRAGHLIGPRMLVAGACVTITGGAGAVTGFAPDVTLPWDLRYCEANSPEQVRERIRTLAG